jgi:hypothetical protein
MIVTSATQTQYTQATNKTTATKATSAYESVTPTTTQQTDRMAQMEEKYKDIYTPMPPRYSEETDNKITSTVREKYPNYLTFDERFKDYRIPYKANVTEQDREKLKELGAAWEENNKKYVESLGGQDGYDACMKYESEVKQDNPMNFWDRKDFKVSNSKELATFYNAAVYEGLESGKSLQDARIIASHAVSSFMDTSKTIYNVMVTSDTMVAKYGPGGIVPDWSRDGAVNYKQNIDLREYGFDMGPTTTKNSHNENVMADFAQKKLDYFNFIVDNQNIVDRKFNDLNPSYIRGRNSYDDIVKPVIDEYLPQAQVAVEVFNKYKIFDSIDIKG